MAFGIGRRQFISVIGGATVAWSVAARAQQLTLPVVGFLNNASPGPFVGFVAAFREGLHALGYVGQNVTIEFRWAEGQYDRLPCSARTLAGCRPRLSRA
jgi:putative ABC transport system substrate-binding protein